MAGSFSEQGPARRSDSRIDDDHVGGLLREVTVRLRDCKCAVRDFEGLDFVGDVDDLGVGADAQDDALHRSGEMVRGSEIGCERDDASGHVRRPV